MAEVAPVIAYQKPPLVPSNARASTLKHVSKRVKVEIKPITAPAVAGNYEHRHFDSLHPTCNKLLQKRWEEYVRSIHLHRLRTAKPSIDDSRPKVYTHLDIRLKKTQMEEERVHNIEKNNNILFNRIMFQKFSDTEVSGIIESRSYDRRRNHIVEAHDHIKKSRLDKILRENQNRGKGTKLQSA
ncbi:hypothetical protein BC830DRAFT_819169 [Chytriomyces sp. MP71]|nr:hypothetical protein BC830DRAFT_819169 [Chytriomyces sp. MP71]